MGLSPFHGSECQAGSLAPSPVDPRFGNPNPKRFQILRHEECFSWTAVEVSYPDAKNYEGRKIMVYQHTYAKIEAQNELDPHFCDDGAHLSPFARFEPTKDGWEAACLFIRTWP